MTIIDDSAEGRSAEAPSGESRLNESCSSTTTLSVAATNVVAINVTNTAGLRSPDAVPRLQKVVQHISWAPVIVEGAYELIFQGDALGTGWRGLYVTGLGKAQSAWRTRANAFPPLLQLGALMAEYVIRNYGRHYYAKAQNLARRLRKDYDRAFADVDLLLMPTNPMKAPPLPGPNASKAEQMYPGFDSVTNTAPFNITGHPAMSVPVAMSDGLPVGMQLVAKWHEEPAIYRAAAAFEASTDWTQR